VSYSGCGTASPMTTEPGCCRGSGAEGSGKQPWPAAGIGFGEDGLEVVLHGVLGQEQLTGQSLGIAAGREVLQQLGFALAESEGPCEHVESLGGRALLDADGDVLRLRYAWPVDPGGT
jgi:hypothetical protein